MKMKAGAAAGQLVLVVLLMVVISLAAGADTTPTTSQVCEGVIAKLTDCLPYAEGKATSPTSGCCGVVTTTVKNNAECLCQFIALVHQGSPQVKSLGIQEAKVSQLPSSCGLHNVSSSNCSSIAPTSSVGVASSNVTNGTNVAYKVHITLPVEALALVAMIAFLLPFPGPAV